MLSSRADQYDPRVQVRIQRGAAMPAADYLDLLAERANIIASMDAATAGFDALVMPTAPIAPPTIASLADDAAYAGSTRWCCAIHRWSISWTVARSACPCTAR